MTELLYAGNVVNRQLTFTDSAGAVFDPLTVASVIADSSGTAQKTLTIGDLTRVSKGVYTLTYTLLAGALAGTWTITVTATDTNGENPTSQTLTFTVSPTQALYVDTNDLLSYSQAEGTDFGYTSDTDPQFNAFLLNIIRQASAIIDNYCKVPRGFFHAGGYLVTAELADISPALWKQSFLIEVAYQLVARLKYYPILSITSLEVNQAAYGMADSWKTTTTPDYVAQFNEGVITLIKVTPGREVEALRATYTAGYATVPEPVNYVCKQLCANILHGIIQRKLGPTVRINDFTVKVLFPEAFSPELKTILAPYGRHLVSTA